ncbi:hypothetical protein RHCRD62_10203 [Rhodococcus sp. RD6.2]|nr:hypothetical protein RHCRD62_10203 [Rhodococcus sp. RD6.2]
MITAAARYIDDHLWTRSALTVRDRRNLIAHAVVRSAPSHGVAALILRLFQHTDVCPAWHREVGVTTDELAAVLRETRLRDAHTVTDVGHVVVEPICRSVGASSAGSPELGARGPSGR